MMGGKQPHGFTIVEAIIFLAVSGLLLLSAMLLINGKQGKAEFNQGMHQIQNDLQKIVNQVATGYYLNNGGFSCQENFPGGSPVNIQINNSSSAQGQNFGCAFVGEAVQFSPGSNPDQYQVFPLAGAAYADKALTPLTDITAADITPISPGYSPTSEVQTFQIPYGINVSTINGSATGQPAIIVFTTLATPSTISKQQISYLNTGTNEDMVGVGGTAPGMNLHQAEVALRDMCAAGHSPCIYGQPEVLCFNSPTSVQSGVITVGSTLNPTSVTLTIQGHVCP